VLAWLISSGTLSDRLIHCKLLFLADHLLHTVCTPPQANTVSFQPPLAAADPGKAEAVRRLGSALYDKVVLRFTADKVRG
jgi:hypothetical protein